MNHLKVRSCLIDGEVVCCDERGSPPSMSSDVVGTSPRPSSTPSTCWSWTARICAASRSRCGRRRSRASCGKSHHGVRLNEHLAHDCGLTVFQHACKMGWKELSLSDWDRVTGLGVLQIG